MSRWNSLNGQCLRHIRSQKGCPESEWIPGRTVKTYVNDVQTFVSVFRTEQEAKEEAGMRNIHPDNRHLYKNVRMEVV